MFSNPKELKMFKSWLTKALEVGPVTVIFTKKDGSLRELRCTLNENFVKGVRTDDSTTTTRKTNPDVMPVYDLDNHEWRSFRWDSVKEIVLKLA